MRKNAWRACLTIPLMTMSLGGCVMAHTSSVKISCPTIRSYDQATLNKALSEYRLLVAGSKIKQMINDYQVLRDKVRACRGV